MDIQAILKYQRISAQKCRLVANEVRGLKVDKALEFLNFSNKAEEIAIAANIISAISDW